MEAELHSLKIDRSRKKPAGSRWATWWILIGIAILISLGAGRLVYGMLNRATEVEVVRVRASTPGDAARGGDVVLNATGYIVAAHKIELAAKVIGKVAWIGVEKGDHVKEGQELVRLEDEEYRAQVQQAKGNLQNLQAHLDSLTNGSRPEEIARAKADLESSRAEEVNAKVNLDRMKQTGHRPYPAPAKSGRRASQVRCRGCQSSIARTNFGPGKARDAPRDH